MKTLKIGDSIIQVKDYECSNSDEYPSKNKLRLWLYVNLTDACPARCPFCVHGINLEKTSKLDVKKFAETLKQIQPLVSGISLTGGEPMMDPSLLEETINAISNEVESDIELDMVSNGINIARLPFVKGVERFTTIHISRHAVDDKTNQILMQWPHAPTVADIDNAFNDLPDRGATVLNCVLQKQGIHDVATATEFLEMASSLGVANVNFIGMFQANKYCRDQYVSPLALKFNGNDKFRIWNHYHDHEYCQCSSGDYLAQTGYIRFYFRCPGISVGPSYSRQLVYGIDNVLRTGFGNAEEIKL